MLRPDASVDYTHDHTFTCDYLPAELVPDRRCADELRAVVCLKLQQLIGIPYRHWLAGGLAHLVGRDDQRHAIQHHIILISNFGLRDSSSGHGYE